MRKIRVDRERLRRLSNERFRRRLIREALKKRLDAAKSEGYGHRTAAEPVLYAPRVFGLLDKRERAQLLEFVEALRVSTLIRKRHVRVNFSRTERMASCGTLFFLSEVKRILVNAWGPTGCPISCVHVLNNKVAQVLRQIGFDDAIGRRSYVQPTDADVIHWRAVAGVGAEGVKAGEMVTSLRDKLPPALSSPMYDGLVEAMTNCVQHAYEDARADGCGIEGAGEWWMFAQQQHGNLTVVLCDLGIGIPRSLPLTQGGGRVEELMARIGRATTLSHKDSDMIGAAVELGRSRLQEANRGKGLQDVLAVIDEAGEGLLRVYSNRGCYSYLVKGGSMKEDYKDFGDSILGTIIQWSIPLVHEQSNE